MADTEFDFTPDELEAAGAGDTGADPGYQYPTNPTTLKALEHWQDLKLGVIIHWGIYSAIGQAGSWSLHRERLGDFTDPPPDWEGTDAEYYTWYYDQARTFTGHDFDADEWAKACADAGFKYGIFTTKHHDGFCLYDSAYTNCKSTAEDAGLGRDIVREMFDAWRANGLQCGVYFSKADWNSPHYWDRGRKIIDRFHNYDITDEPARWKSFTDFTHNQIRELLENYGDVNVLWLDAGWVRAPREPIGIDAIAAMARTIQPDILVVDREVHGPEENYRTPEQKMADSFRPYPWEACMTWTKSWCSMQVDDPAKPTREIVANLVKIISRGGNYLVGFGPDATGALSAHLKKGLAELGQWMRVCGDYVYGTRALEHSPVITSEGTADWYAVTKGEALILFGINEDDDTVGSSQVTVKGTWTHAAVAGGGTATLTHTTCAGEGCTVVDVGDSPTPYAVAVELTA